MLRTAQLLPLRRAFDTALRRRAFPPDAGSLLPGPLAATRTGLAPAGNDELPTESDHVITQPLPNCRAYSRVPLNFGCGPVSIRAAAHLVIVHNGTDSFGELALERCPECR